MQIYQHDGVHGRRVLQLVSLSMTSIILFEWHIWFGCVYIQSQKIGSPTVQVRVGFQHIGRILSSSDSRSSVIANHERASAHEIPPYIALTCADLRSVPDQVMSNSGRPQYPSQPSSASARLPRARHLPLWSKPKLLRRSRRR